MTITAKCMRCLGSATGNTFEEARNKINHAVGLSRGIKCGKNYNKTVEVIDETIDKTIDKTVDAKKFKEKKTLTNYTTEKPKKLKNLSQ